MRAGRSTRSLVEIPFTTGRRSLDVFSGAIELEVVLVAVAIDMTVGAARTGGFAAVGIVTASHPELVGIPSSAGRAGRFL